MASSSSSSQALVQEDQARSLNEATSLPSDQEKVSVGQKLTKSHPPKLCFGKGKKTKDHKTMNVAKKGASLDLDTTCTTQDKSTTLTEETLNDVCGSKENLANKNTLSTEKEEETRDQQLDSHSKKKRKPTNMDQDDCATSSLLLCLKKRSKSYKKQRKCESDKVSCIISDSTGQDNSSNTDVKSDTRKAQQIEGLGSEQSPELKCESTTGIWASFRSLAMSRNKVQKSKEQKTSSEAQSGIDADVQDSSMKHNGSKAKISFFKKCQKGQKKSTNSSVMDDAHISLQAKQVKSNQNELEAVNHEITNALLESEQADKGKNSHMDTSLIQNTSEKRADEKCVDFIRKNDTSESSLVNKQTPSLNHIQDDQSINNIIQSQNVESMTTVNEEIEETNNMYTITDEAKGSGRFQRVKEKSMKKVFCVNALQQTIKKANEMQQDEEKKESEINKIKKVKCAAVDENAACHEYDETMKSSEDLNFKNKNVSIRESLKIPKKVTYVSNNFTKESTTGGKKATSEAPKAQEVNFTRRKAKTVNQDDTGCILNSRIYSEESAAITRNYSNINENKGDSLLNEDKRYAGLYKSDRNQDQDELGGLEKDLQANELETNESFDMLLMQTATSIVNNVIQASVNQLADEIHIKGMPADAFPPRMPVEILITES